MTPEHCIRVAVKADLPRMTAIWYEDEIAGEEPPGFQPERLEVYSYLLANGDVRVALTPGGAMTGFGATVTWPSRNGTLTYLSDLFVAQATQSRGVGQALLDNLAPRQGARGVMASKDPRATALYVRWGMRPRWPHYWLTADSRALAARLGALPGADVAVSPVDLDETFLRWDHVISGLERGSQLRWMVATRAAKAYWLERRGEPIGYAVVQRRSEESLWRPDAWTLGPIGAFDPNDAAACVSALVRDAARSAPALRVAIPGPHAALPALLNAGFTITYIETFLASEGGQPFDAERYLGSGIFL
ncbi:MAG TPA: GNAT family N-acetyltransferase [Ktedonobacterales bacterium]